MYVNQFVTLLYHFCCVFVNEKKKIQTQRVTINTVYNRANDRERERKREI